MTVKRPWGHTAMGVAGMARDAYSYYKGAKKIKDSVVSRRPAKKVAASTSHWVPVDKQHKTLYSKKKRRITKAGRRRSRKWKQFKKKVDRVIMKLSTMNFYGMFNLVSDTYSTAAVLLQTQFVIQPLLSTDLERIGCNFGFDHVNQDNRYITNQLDNISFRSAATDRFSSTIQQIKYKVRHREHILTMENTMPTSVAEPITFDAYICVANQSTGINPASGNTPGETMSWLLGASGTEIITAAARRPAISDPGITPFNVPGFGKYWKVLSVDRHNIYPIQTVDLRMVCKKGWVGGSQYHDKAIVKGRTMFWLIILNPEGRTMNWPVSTGILRMRVKHKVHYQVPFTATGTPGTELVEYRAPGTVAWGQIF